MVTGGMSMHFITYHPAATWIIFSEIYNIKEYAMRNNQLTPYVVNTRTFSIKNPAVKNPRGFV